MSKVRVFLRYWLPVCLWAMVIFTASGDAQSFNRSSRIIAPLVRWLLPHLDDATVDWIVFALRKCAHAVEYAVLVWLVWRALRQPTRGDARPWSPRIAWLAFLLAVGYAMTDELHQTIVPTRQGAWLDVMIDTAGAAFGLLAVWLAWWVKRHRWRPGTSSRDILPADR